MIEKRFVFSLIVVLSCLYIGSASAAIMIEARRDRPTTVVGDTFSIDVAISGLAFSNAPSVDTFDIDLEYDSSLLALGAVTFGDQLDILGFGSIQFTDTTSLPETISVLEISRDSEDTLNGFQKGSFVLFSVEFEALSTGFATFDLTIINLLDPQGNRLFASRQEDSILVRPPPGVIPLPAAVWLFGSALLGLVGFARQRKDLGHNAQVIR